MKFRIDNKFLLNTSFALFFLSEFLFAHTLIAQSMLLVFCASSVLTFNKIHKNIFLISYILFTVWSFAIIRNGYAISHSTAMDMTITLCWNIVFLFAFSQYCGTIDDPIHILKIYKKICICLSVLFVVLGISDVLSGNRLAVMGINANGISMFAAYSMIIQIYEMSIKKVTCKDILIVLLFVIVILLSGSRKGFLIPFIGLYVLLCMKKPKKIIKYTIVIAILGISLIWLTMNIPLLYDILGHRLEAILQFLQGADYDEGSLQTRSHLIKYAWARAQDSLVWGHGLDCFRTLRHAYGTYSHCNYVELLFSTGWVGTIIYYSTAVITLIRVPRYIKNNNLHTSILLAIFIPFLVCDYMNVTYFERTMIIIPALVIMSIVKNNKKEIQNER